MNIADLNFRITTNGAQAIRNMDRVGQRANRLSGSFRNLGGAIAAVVIGRAVSTIARMADEYSNVNAQVKLVAKSQEDIVKLQKGALANAILTRNSFAASGTIIARLGRSAERFGGSTEQVLKVSRAIQETFRISGATVRESEAATLQLAQSLGKGVLNGDELRSVLENNLLIAQVIADEFGVSVDQLKALGAQGILTSDRVFKALLRDAEEINEKFEQIPKTFGDSFAVIKTTATVAFGEINKELGISEKLFEKVSELSQSFLTGTGLTTAVTLFQNIQFLISGIGLGLNIVVLQVKKLALEARIAANEFFSFGGNRTKDELVERIKFRNAEIKRLNAQVDSDVPLFGSFKNATRDRQLEIAKDDLRKARDELSGIEGPDVGLKASLDAIDSELQAAFQKSLQRYDEHKVNVEKVATDVAATSAKIAKAFSDAQQSVNQTLAFDTEDPNFVGGADLFGGAKGIAAKAAADAEQIGAVYKAVFEDVQQVGTNAFGNMFNELENGLDEAAKAFVGTWLAALQDIIASRLATQFAELLLGGSSSPQGGFGGAVGFLGSLFRGGNKGAQGFRNGGSFLVGGSGGADSQRVSFLASPNETVSIKTPSQQRSEQTGGVTINQSLVVEGGANRAEIEQGFLRQKKEIIATMQQMKSQGRF